MKLSHKIIFFFVIVFFLLFTLLITITNIIADIQKGEQLYKSRSTLYQEVILFHQNSDNFSNILISYLNTKDKSLSKIIDEILKKERIHKTEALELKMKILKKLDFKVLDDLSMLEQLKIVNYAQKISEMEIEAIQALRGYFKDKNGYYTIKKSPNKDFAVNILASKVYKELNKDLNQTVYLNSIQINDEYLLALKNIKKEEQYAFIFIFILTAILSIVIVVSYFIFTNDIIKPLKKLNSWIKQIKKDDYKIKKIDFPNDEIGLVMNSFYNMAKKINKDIDKLKNLSTTDSLTQLNNRITLDKVLQDAHYSYERYGTKCSIILIDIDHFKKVNDTYGHNIGDIFLKEFADILRKEIRLSDIVGRWGGEEFLIICKNNDSKQAFKVAQKLRKEIESFNFSYVNHKTASFGVSELTEDKSIYQLIDDADKALYEAKRSGRNQVIVK